MNAATVAACTIALFVGPVIGGLIAWGIFELTHSGKPLQVTDHLEGRGHVFPKGSYTEWYSPELGRMTQKDVSGESRGTYYFDPVTRDALVVHEIEEGLRT